MAFSRERIPCPTCRSEGRDSTGNHLHVFEDGKGGWCQRHEYVRLEEGEEVDTTKRYANSGGRKDDSAQVMALVSTYPIVEYPQRKISKESMEFFGIRTALDQSTREPAEHWYPYHEEDGSISGYKTRILPKDFSRGVTGKIKSLFGQYKTKGTKFLLIVEGEHDCVAGRDMMRKLKPDREPYNIVSLPNGANEEGTIDGVVRKQLEWLSKFEKIVLILDQDAPGRATANALADYLVSAVDVRIAELPLKDTAAMWEAGREDEWARAINNSRKYVSEQIVLGSDTPLEQLMQPLKEGIKLSFLPQTSRKMHGFRTREMTTLIAPPKCGKSSLLRQMIFETLRDNPEEQVGGFFLEETHIKTKQSIIAYHAGVSLNQYRANPKCADKYKVQEAYDTLLPRLHLFTHKGKTISDDLLERKLDYLVKSLGCTTTVIDHTTFVIGTRATNNERRDIDMMLTRLARSVEDENYRLFVVAHIKRGAREQSRTDNKVKYPYWEILSPDDTRGSGAYEQLSHNLIGIERQRLDPEEENTRGLVRTRILFNREWGVEGIGDYLSFGQDGKFTPVQIEY